MPPQNQGGNSPKIQATLDLNIQPALQKLNQFTQAANRAMNRAFGGGGGGGGGGGRSGGGNVSGQPAGTGGSGGGGNVFSRAWGALNSSAAAGGGTGGAGPQFGSGASAPRFGGSQNPGGNVSGVPAGTAGSSLWRRLQANSGALGGVGLGQMAQRGGGAVPEFNVTGRPAGTLSQRLAMRGVERTIAPSPGSSGWSRGDPRGVPEPPRGNMMQPNALGGRLAIPQPGTPAFNAYLANANAQAMAGGPTRGFGNMPMQAQGFSANPGVSRWNNFQEMLRMQSPASRAGGQGTAWQGARALGGQALGGLTSAASGGAGVVGSVMLWQVAEDMAKIQREGLARDRGELEADYTRESSQRRTDFLKGTLDFQKEQKELVEEYNDLSKEYGTSIERIQRNMGRSLRDSERAFEGMNRQGEQMLRNARYQQEDYVQAVEDAEKNRAIGMERALRDRATLERNYGRTVADIDLDKQRRLEDYAETYSDIQRAQTRAQEDFAKEEKRLGEDRVQYEKEVGIQQKERMEALQEQRQDQGLDRAIGGLSLMQAMRSGNLIGILSAVRNLRNLNRQRRETDEMIGRGGMTELEAAQQEGARRGFDRRGEDLQTGAVRAGEDFAEQWEALTTQIRRDTENEQIARVRAWEDTQTALQGINDRINDIQRAYDAQVEAAQTANTRFWEQYRADAAAWQADWKAQEEAHQQIVDDARREAQAVWEEVNKRHKDLLKRQDELLGKEAERINAYETLDKLAEIMKKRREEDLKTQERMIEQQEKMGKAFNILFGGMVLQNIGQVITGLGSMFGMLLGGSAAVKAILGGKTAAEATTAATEAASTVGKGLGAAGRLGAAGVGAALGVATVGVAGETNFLGLGEGIMIPGTNIPIQAPKVSAALGAWDNQEGQAKAIAEVFGQKDNPVAVASILGALKSGTTAFDIVMNPGRILGEGWQVIANAANKTIGGSQQTGGFAAGGVIAEPSAIISLLSGRMLGVMAERGPERIIQSDQKAHELARMERDIVRSTRRDSEFGPIGGAAIAGGALGSLIGNLNVGVNWQGDAGNLRDRRRLAEDVGIMVLRMLADRMRQKGLVR